MVTKVKGASSHIVSETKDPDVSATFIGQIWVNASSNNAWVSTSVGTGAVDWVGIDANAAVSDASETLKGIVELATQAETDAGTDDARVITPLKLANYSGITSVVSATETVEGIVELATQAEVDAETDDTRAVTSLKLATYVRPDINDQTGTTYTLVLTDDNSVVRASNASAITLTVPPNSSVAFPIGSIVQVRQVGAGQVTLSPGAGVTLNTAETLISRKQGSTVGLMKVGTDEWDITGDLEAV